MHGIQCVLNLLKQHHQNAVFVLAFNGIRPRNCRRYIDFKHLRRQNLTACVPDGNLRLDCLCLGKNLIRQGKLASARGRIRHFPLIKKCAAVRLSERDTHPFARQIDCHTVFIQAYIQICGFCIILHRANPDTVRLFVHINFQPIIRFCHFPTPFCFPHQKSTSVSFSDAPFLTEYLSFVIISIRKGLPLLEGRSVRMVLERPSNFC